LDNGVYTKSGEKLRSGGGTVSFAAGRKQINRLARDSRFWGRRELPQSEESSGNEICLRETRHLPHKSERDEKKGSAISGCSMGSSPGLSFDPEKGEYMWLLAEEIG